MKKSSVDAFFNAYYDAAGKIRRPRSEQERQRLANAMIGFVGVQALEQAFARARGKLKNRQPKRPPGGLPSDADVRDATLGKVLGTLSETQRHAVLQLVRDELYLLIFSLFGALDEFPFGLLSVNVTFAESLDADDEANDDLDDRPPDVTIVPHQAELHSQWVSSANKFSSVLDIEGRGLWIAEAEEEAD